MKLFKFLLIFLLPLFFTPLQAQPQEISESLSIADSLFRVKQYTQALKVYDAIYDTGEMVSPAMVLRMAYIYEGLDRIPDALYYLNLYYLETSNPDALVKMKSLADKNRLSGYEYEGFEVLVRYYNTYYEQIVIAISILVALLFAYVLYRKLFRKMASKQPAIAFVLSSALLFYLINFGQVMHQGIIENGNCYLMSAPSSSSDVIAIVKAGHKVKIIDHKDVWLKIKFGDKVVYTKEKNIRPIIL